MNDPSHNGDVETLPASPHVVPRTGLRWWLSVAEVRFRLIGLVLLALLVATQWGRFQSWSRDAWHRWFGHGIEAAVSPDTEYFCPMDPGVVSDWPAICPICNMDLVPRKKTDAQLLPEGVVARMQLTPYRIQLAGIRTSEVVPMELEQKITLFGVLSEDEETLVFEAAISRADVDMFTEPRDATVSLADDRQLSTAAVAEFVQPEESDGDALNEIPRVRIALTEPGDDFAAGSHVQAVVRVPVAEIEAVDGQTPSSSEVDATAAAEPSASLVLAIPQSAVVDHGYQQLVFVETMAGMFDAVTVDLGPRCGEYYPVLDGLNEGEKVVVNGAFLIDAETRLNPSLAVQYFGANQASATGRMPELRMAGMPTELSPEDLALAEQQAICPVTLKPLDSMGGPVLVTVEGRKIFICCRGCERALTSDPDKYLERLSSDD